MAETKETMTAENQTADPPSVSPGRVFLRGFLGRLLCGVFGFLPMVLLFPDLLGDKLPGFLCSIGLYLAVCVAGGVNDMKAGQVAKLPLLGRRQSVGFPIALVLLFLLLFLRSRR